MPQMLTAQTTGTEMCPASPVVTPVQTRAARDTPPGETSASTPNRTSNRQQLNQSATTTVRFSQLTGRLLRARQDRRLLAFEMLSAAQRRALGKFEEQGDLYGVSLPLDGGSVKVVDNRTAALLDALRQPTSSEAALRDWGVREQALLRLLFDGLLEVEGVDGFVTGVEAHRLLAPALQDEQAEAQGMGDALRELSYDALLYAASLPEQHSRLLSSRLYAFNTVPIAARWRSSFADELAHRAGCGVRPGQAVARLLAREYRPLEVPGWWAWSHRSQASAEQLRSAAPQPETPRYKLYVSPHPEALHSTFRVVARVLSMRATPSFKIGSDLRGALRPDKIVAHFSSRAELDSAAAELMAELCSMPPQGVPFTASLAGTAPGRGAAGPSSQRPGQDTSLLLSRGVDPPLDAASAEWRGVESWRAWVCNELATGIVAARKRPSSRARLCQFAVDRLRLQGVDPVSWTATEGERGE